MIENLISFYPPDLHQLSTTGEFLYWLTVIDFDNLAVPQMKNTPSARNKNIN